MTAIPISKNETEPVIGSSRSQKNSTFEVKDTRNKDLNIDDIGPDTLMSKMESPPRYPELNIKKKVVRRAVEDGFFKTGVEVIENEEIDFEGTAQDAAKAFQEG